MTQDLPMEPLGTVEEEAAFWAVRLASPDCRPEDRRAFELWRRADPAHALAYEQTQTATAFVDRHVGHDILQDLAERVRTRTEPKGPSRWQVAALAASLALILGAVTFSGWWMARPGPEGVEVAATGTYETAVGERSTVVLSDGTTVTLNTNSRVVIDYTGEQRGVRLTKGQAFFEVAKETARPFIVSAGDKRVIALGTAFDVRFETESDIKVTLLEGRVSVDGLLKDLSTRGDEGSQVELSPGQQLIVQGDIAPEVVVPDMEAETSWRQGFLVFRDEPLAKAIAEMNRYSVQQLVVDEDERLATMTISGVFNAGRASDFVSALEAMRPVAAERSGVNELTLVWRD